MKKLFLSLTIGLLTTLSALAQPLRALAPEMGHANHPGHHRGCGTDIMYQRYLQADPSIAAIRQELEDFTSDYQESQLDKSNPGDPVLVIPVVFHVIHNWGVENINIDQVRDAVRILNETYNKRNNDSAFVHPDFTSVHARCRIEFRLATLDPNGNCTQGMTKTVSALTNGADDNVKALISWPRNRYVNIWVVESIDLGSSGPTTGIILGYATLPGTAAPGTDGLVVRSDNIGSIGSAANGGLSFQRTLTHEMGHFLNLLHPWGSGQVGVSCNGSDGVSDTPPTSGSFGGCDLNAFLCGTRAMVQNYMDYSDCPRLFTMGQSLRMRAALNSSTGQRNSLWSASNLAATGTTNPPTTNTECAPVVTLKAHSSRVCLGTAASLQADVYNSSPNNVTYTWRAREIGGSNFFNSVTNAPSGGLTIGAPGSYQISVVASNSLGSDKDSLNIVVSTYGSTNAFAIGNNFVESIENAAWPQLGGAQNWTIDQAGSNVAWARTTAAAFTGSASVRINNRTQPAGAINSLVSPTIQLQGLSTPVNLRFRWAFAQRAANNTDELRVKISTNCGQTWQTRRTITATSNPSLSTTGTLYTGAPIFVPAATQWLESSIVLSTFVNAANGILVAFDMVSGGGNALYLDDIRITDPTGVSIPTNISGSKWALFPNPASANEGSVLQIPAGSENQNLKISLLDLSGRAISEAHIEAAAGIEQTKTTAELFKTIPTKGVYLVKIQGNEVQQTIKWVVE